MSSGIFPECASEVGVWCTHHKRPCTGTFRIRADLCLPFQHLTDWLNNLRSSHINIGKVRVKCATLKETLKVCAILGTSRRDFLQQVCLFSTKAHVQVVHEVNCVSSTSHNWSSLPDSSYALPTLPFLSSPL